MNLDQFIAKYSGQSVLWAPSAAREYLRGQCVQLVCFYVQEVWGKPVIWADAYDWFAKGAFPEHYTRVANDHNDPNQIPPRGALMVWGPNLANSGGAGHISIVVQANPGSATFITFDSNWGGKTAHLVTHNWSEVVGWIVPTGGKGADAPAPQPASTGGDLEMITTDDQAQKLYRMLRPNGAANAEEIAATVGRRSYANFVNDAQNEIAQRDANIRAQGGQMQQLQATIDELNKTITNLQVDGITTKQEYDKAVAKVADLTTQLTTTHDQLKELQDAVQKPVETTPPTKPDAPQAGLIVKIIAAFLRRKKS